MSPQRRPPDATDEFLTVAIRNWIDAGSLPALRVGRRVRVLRRDLDQLLAVAETSATSASQPGADAGQDGQGWPDAQAFWGGA